jgi:UDP-glucose 6-dehydrogenase
MYKIAGTGYVGLVATVCFTDFIKKRRMLFVVLGIVFLMAELDAPVSSN